MMVWLMAAVPLVCLLMYGLFLMRTAWFFARIRPREKASTPTHKVSVIIPARNESGSIGRCLRGVLQQDYPAHLLQVIVVNDHSEDDTRSIAQSIAESDSRLLVLDLPSQQGTAYKKAAVTFGIAHATGDIILTTDADCSAGPGWVSAMAAHFDRGVGMVSGPVMLTGPSLFAKLQTLEFMGLIAVGGGSIAAGTPNMCNGANLAYRKDLFEALGGFKGVDGIASGDDEFLLHRMAKSGKGSIAFAKCKDAIVSTPAQSGLRSFITQRRRWVSKSTHYERKSITWVLVAAYLAMLTFPLLTGLAIWAEPACWWALIAAFGFKTIAEMSVLVPAAHFFGVKRLLPLVLPEQLLHVPYLLFIGIAGNVGDVAWKGRKVK
jgi:cellulose synthase/poly-beta-1,6-N-acetylglucosamine synthase-like glycosyltransferase